MLQSNVKEIGKDRGVKGSPDTESFFWHFLFSETECFEKYRQKVIDGFLFEATVQKYT